MAVGEIVHQSISSEVETGTSDLDGTRHSRDSEPSVFNCPSGFVINRDSVVPHVISERGSEHEYNMTFDNMVEVIPGTKIVQPTRATLTTHARSDKGPKGGGGAMKVTVAFDIVRYKD